VVGTVAPWNYPQTLAAFKHAPAMARSAGCGAARGPAAGAGKICTGDLVVFLQPVAVAPAVVRRERAQPINPRAAAMLPRRGSIRVWCG
jgi:hypothetical protein